MFAIDEEKRRKAIEQEGLSAVLCGMIVHANHPITCMNPDETFEVKEAKIENGGLYLKGEKTMWFHTNLLTKVAT